MHGILSANPKGPFIILVLRDEKNNRLQTDAALRLCLLALFYFRTNILRISKSGQRPRHTIMRFNRKFVSVLLSKGSWQD